MTARRLDIRIVIPGLPMALLSPRLRHRSTTTNALLTGNTMAGAKGEAGARRPTSLPEAFASRFSQAMPFGRGIR